jgi:hypothetical protein
MTRFLVPVLLAALLMPATAAEEGIAFRGDRGIVVDRVVTPPGSPLRFAGFRSENQMRLAQFAGRVLITGTYSYGDAEFNDGPNFVGQAVITPNADARGRLPYFARRSGRYAIHIVNADIFARAVIPRETLLRVSRKRGGYATGEIAIWADRFAAGIVCDGPSYDVRFLSVSRPEARIARSGPSAGC